MGVERKPIGERIASMEANLETVKLTQEQTLALLREQKRETKEKEKEFGQRMAAVEQEQVRTKTNFRWLYGIWAFAQAGLVGWLKSKLPQ